MNSRIAPDKRRGDDVLNFQPLIPEGAGDVVFEGMPREDARKETGHYSRNLQLLIQASDRFWKNANPEDSDTQPTNERVAEWLRERGMSGRQAESGASIIRPEWAMVGRKPEKR
jgi:hypothetical protein